MKNAIPRSLNDLFTLSEKAADGLHTYESAIGLMHNTEAVVRSELATARSANNEYQTAKGAKVLATGAQSTADTDAVKLIFAAREVLKPRLGARYSPAWNEAGFVNQTLELPGTISKRMELVKSLELYFTNHPTHEVASLGVTAAKAGELHAAFSAGASGANGSLRAQLSKRDARDEAAEKLRKRLRGLVAELEQLIGEDDVRWLEFGFKIPGAEQTPEPPTALTVRPGATGHLVVDWSDAPRAEYYRVYKQLVDQPDGEFVLAATVGDTDADLNTFTSGARVRVKVVAVNDRGESQASEVVEHQVP